MSAAGETVPRRFNEVETLDSRSAKALLSLLEIMSLRPHLVYTGYSSMPIAPSLCPEITS